MSRTATLHALVVASTAMPVSPSKLHTYVGGVVQAEVGACTGCNKSPHGGQVAPREYMLPDEVAAAAVRLVPLVWLADCLQMSMQYMVIHPLESVAQQMVVLEFISAWS